jgi:NAD(P)-dependent dehydrogenase (short-subunit alcohol dehydrogenase family)
MPRRVVVVVGAGPGVGAAIARRFGREEYDVALIARGRDRLEELGRQLHREGVGARWAALDVVDSEGLAAAINRFGEQLGRIDVLHFNPSVFRPSDALQLTAHELVEDLRVGVAALLTCVQAARPVMPAGARITVTGSMAADRPSAAAASLGVQRRRCATWCWRWTRPSPPPGSGRCR